MKWKKLGLIYQPNKNLPWQNSHAALPTACLIADDLYRIYFTSRDGNNKTHIGYFDLKIGVPGVIINYSDTPVLSPGRLGMFDDHGVQATSVVKFGSKIYLYYLGWNIGYPQPLFYTSIGLAVSNDGGNTFQKYSDRGSIQENSDSIEHSRGTHLKFHRVSEKSHTEKPPRKHPLKVQRCILIFSYLGKGSRHRTKWNPSIPSVTILEKTD